MNVSVCDTGNSMIDLSSKIDMQELRKYRIIVGKMTRHQMVHINESMRLKKKCQQCRYLLYL